MTEQTKEIPDQKIKTPPRIIADYGGRRRLLDRRVTHTSSNEKERRSGKERRCGFDRRSALNQSIEIEHNQRKHLDGKIDTYPMV